MVERMKHNCGGFFDWVVQRVTAVVIGVYALVVLGFLLAHSGVSYDAWHGFYAALWMRIFTVIVAASVLWHAWIGLWTVFTDYVKARCIRLFLEIVVALMLLGYFVWLLDILWR